MVDAETVVKKRQKPHPAKCLIISSLSAPEWAIYSQPNYTFLAQVYSRARAEARIQLLICLLQLQNISQQLTLVCLREDLV